MYVCTAKGQWHYPVFVFLLVTYSIGLSPRNRLFRLSQIHYAFPGATIANTAKLRRRQRRRRMRMRTRRRKRRESSWKITTRRRKKDSNLSLISRTLSRQKNRCLGGSGEISVIWKKRAKKDVVVGNRDANFN